MNEPFANLLTQTYFLILASGSSPIQLNCWEFGTSLQQAQNGYIELTLPCLISVGDLSCDIFKLFCSES